jgi:hypothetical protein
MTVDEFLACSDGRWRHAPPASPSAMERLVEASQFTFPATYLEFLNRSNGGDGFLSVPPYYLRLWPAEEVVGNNLDYQMPEFVPGFFAFADAGGEEFFAFDIRPKGDWRVYAIPFVPMEVASASLVAADFQELLEHVIATPSVL